MKKLACIFTAVLVVMLSGCMKPDTSYSLSEEPHIINLPKQKMLVAEASGTPEKISGDCIMSLYQVYFGLKFSGKLMEPPHGRWPAEIPKEGTTWKGVFGIKIPESVTVLPEMKKKTAVDVKIGYWEYGDTAEILYKGPYEGETPTVDKLKSFIKAEGYKINGAHEEIYLKGPGMFGKGDPQKYMTIIRYPVKKMK